jgi:hypothetical protein
MAENEYEKSKIKHPTQDAVHFDEAPGEAEADAVRDEFLKNAGTEPAQVASALSSADSSTRSRTVSRLQKERGNGYVQRVVAQTRGASGRMVGLPQDQMVDEVQRRKGSGTEIAGDARQKLEGHFAADLSEVRVHTDGESTALNRELNSQAFTVGRDIFMAEGKYNPGSSDGQGLLAHELTHVGQQTGFAAQTIQRASEEEDDQASPAATTPVEEEPPAAA